MRTPLPPIPDLPAVLCDLIRQVQRGRVTTPGALAAAMGNPVAARWIGHFLLHHDHDSACACHRVVRAGGVLGPYPDGSEEKARLLEEEGVEVIDGQIHGSDCSFADFTCDRPLEKLARFQNRLAKKVQLLSRRGVPRLVGGVDVSYCCKGTQRVPGPIFTAEEGGQSHFRDDDSGRHRPQSGRENWDSPQLAKTGTVPCAEGVAAYALVEVASGKLVWWTTIRRPVRFPYITSYLTFRELPLLIELLEVVRRQDRISPVVMVDGTGILHPRRAGIASHLGVVAGIPTVGVTKKLLCGQVNVKGLRLLESRPVLLDEEPVGAAIRPTSGSFRPLFLSPGSGVDLASAVRIASAVLAGKRLPLPLYWADRLSRQGAKNCDKLEVCRKSTENAKTSREFG